MLRDLPAFSDFLRVAMRPKRPRGPQNDHAAPAIFLGISEYQGRFLFMVQSFATEKPAYLTLRPLARKWHGSPREDRPPNEDAS